MTQPDLRQRLLHRRGEILGRLHGETCADAMQPFELDNLDVLFRIDLASRRELNRINNALERMESGIYGLCRDCGETIDAQRLRDLPLAETCAGCADVEPG